MSPADELKLQTEARIKTDDENQDLDNTLKLILIESHESLQRAGLLTVEDEFQHSFGNNVHKYRQVLSNDGVAGDQKIQVVLTKLDEHVTYRETRHPDMRIGVRKAILEEMNKEQKLSLRVETSSNPDPKPRAKEIERQQTLEQLANSDEEVGENEYGDEEELGVDTSVAGNNIAEPEAWKGIDE